VLLVSVIVAVNVIVWRVESGRLICDFVTLNETLGNYSVHGLTVLHSAKHRLVLYRQAKKHSMKFP